MLLLTGFVKAQSPAVEWLAKNTRPDGDTYIEKPISLDNNGLLALRGREPMMAISYTKLFLQSYDNDFKPGIVREIPYRLSTDVSPDNGKTPTMIYMGKFLEDVYIFSGSSNKDNKTHTLHAQKINAETFDLDNEDITLFDVSLTDKEFHGPDKNVKVKPTGPGQFEITNTDKDFRGPGKNFHLVRSSDGNNLLALFHCPGSKDQQRKVIIYIYNNHLQLRWKKEVTLNYSSEQLFFNACSIDNNGNVAISEMLYKGKPTETGARKINYDYILFYIPHDGDLIETKLSIPGISLARLEQTFDNKGNLVCGGFYTSPSMPVFKGIFIIKTEPGKGSMLSSNFKPFSPEYLRTMLSTDVKDLDLVNPGSLDDYGYNIKELIVLDNGTIKFVAEQKIEVTCRRKATVDLFNFRSVENILCASADNTGKIQWISRIPKKQYAYPGYDSYYLKLLNGTLYFLYNEALENIKSNKSEYFSGDRKYIAVATSIDENGKLTTNELWDPGIDKVMLVPKSCFSSGDQEIIIEARKGKNEYFGKISFK